MTTENKQVINTDYGVAKLALIGLLGFFAGCIILFYDSMFDQKTSSFHEVQYNPRTNAQQIVGQYNSELQQSIKKYKQSADSLRAELKKTGDPKPEEADSIKRKRIELNAGISKADSLGKLDNEKQQALKKYIGYYTNGLADVDSLSFKELNKVLHFQISPDTVERWECLFDSLHLDSLGPVSFSFKDPQANLRDSIAGTTFFKIKQTTNNLAFIVRYPSAGTWVLLILVFCSFCFIAVATCFSLRDKAQAIFKNANYQRTGKKVYLKISVLTAISIAVFIGSWGISFYDGEVVKNLFFMRHLITSVYAVLIIGCIAGSFCLAGFIYTASTLNFFKDESKKTLVKHDTNTDDKPADVAAAKTDGSDVNKPDVQQNPLQASYKKLIAIFRSYFVIASILLSLTVLCTGALFNTINSLDFLKLMNDDWGYSPLRGDFVYFYGALFTIILLLVYVPAKIKFSEIEVGDPDAGTTADQKGQSKFPDIFKSPFGQLKDVLVVTSPLLASLVQSTLENLFK